MTSPGVRLRRRERFHGGLERMLGGGQLFLSKDTPPSHGGSVALAASMPGEIQHLQISAADQFMVRSGSFVASTNDIEVWVGLQRKLGVGVFGSAGRPWLQSMTPDKLAAALEPYLPKENSSSVPSGAN
ncbi:MAG: AIM24 family protein [Mycobacterium sp.]|nr:AIM24 family protein [Mycobacterium sp.]